LWAQRYARKGNALFIPEAQGGVTGTANALYAIGGLCAIGFSPFGIDDEGNLPLDLIGITHGERPDNSAISNLYSILSNLASLVVQKQQEGDIAAGLIEGEAQRAAKVYIGTYVANVVRPANPALAGSRIGVMFLR